MKFEKGQTPWNKGKAGYKNPPLSAEAREKIRQQHLGMKASAEARQHMSEARKGKMTSEATKAKLRITSSGNKYALGMPPNSTSFRPGQVAWNKGKPHLVGIAHPNWQGGMPNCAACGKPLKKKTSKVCRECYQKNVLCKKTGPAHHNWKGGITSETQKIRTSLEYRAWRKQVFERDDYTCVFCGKRGGSLEVDHIKPFAYHKELRFDLDNGRTLCVPCHKTTETYLGKSRRKSIRAA